jgi:hypothetical protein
VVAWTAPGEAHIGSLTARFTNNPLEIRRNRAIGAVDCAQHVYQARAQGEPVTDPLYAFDNFVDMIGFPNVWDFEKKYADLLAEDFRGLRSRRGG